MDALTFYGKRYDSLPDALESMENEIAAETTGNILLIPPIVDEETDEEDCDDDLLLEGHIPNDFPGIILELFEINVYIA